VATQFLGIPSDTVEHASFHTVAGDEMNTVGPGHVEPSSYVGAVIAPD
jgi:hypothetical protein